MGTKRKAGFYYCDVWKMNFHYCIGWSIKDFLKYLNDTFEVTTKGLESSNGRCMLIESDSRQVVVIWTRVKTDIPALVHECVHAACNTLDMRGWKPDLDNEEPLAYLVETILEKSGVKFK